MGEVLAIVGWNVLWAATAWVSWRRGYLARAWEIEKRGFRAIGRALTGGAPSSPAERRRKIERAKRKGMLPAGAQVVRRPEPTLPDPGRTPSRSVVTLRGVRDGTLYLTGTLVIGWEVVTPGIANQGLVMLGALLLGLPLVFPPAPAAIEAPVTEWVAEDPEKAMVASDPEEWCTCGSGNDAVPVEVVYDPDKPPVVVAHLCPDCRERVRPGVATGPFGLKPKQPPARIPWALSTSGVFAAQKRLKDTQNQIAAIADTATFVGENLIVSKAAAESFKALCDEAAELKRQIDQFTAEPLGGSTISTGPGGITIGGHEVTLRGGRADGRRVTVPDLTPEITAYGERYQYGGGYLYTHVPARPPVTDGHDYEDESYDVREWGSMTTTRTFHVCATCGRPPEEHGRRTCVACGGRGKAFGYDCDPCGATGLDPLYGISQ